MPLKRRQNTPLLKEVYRGHKVTLEVTCPGDGTMVFDFKKD